MEFTGDYNRCTECGHIYDFNDICPECGQSEIEDLNAKQVKEWAKTSTYKEVERLNKMLELHDDL